MSASQIFAEIVKVEEEISKCTCKKVKSNLQDKLNDLENSI
jgi:hypothetical protein